MSYLKKTVLSALLMYCALMPLSYAWADSIQNISNPYNFYSFYLSSDGTTLVSAAIDNNGDHFAFHWDAINGFQQLDTLSGANTVAQAISNDNSTIIGYLDGPGAQQAVKWVNGNAIQALGFLPGGSISVATGVSGDGSIIVGGAIDASSQTQAVRWVGNNTIENLGVLPGGFSSSAQAISADGTTIVGISNDSNGGGRAVRWVGNNGIEALDAWTAGSNFAEARFVNTNGSIIGGDVNDLNGNTIMARWVGNNPVEVLGVLPGGTYSQPSAMSADGSVMIGSGDTSTSSAVPLRSVGGNQVQVLDILSGDTYGFANAVNANGSVIVGVSYDSGFNGKAVRWVGNNPVESLSNLLTAKNVDLSGWNLNVAGSINANGDIIAGNGTLNGVPAIFISNIATGGLTTPVAMAQSLGSTVAASQQANQTTLSGLGQSLFTAEHLSALSVSMAPSSVAPVPTPSSQVVTHPDGTQSFAINNDDGGYGLLTPYEPSFLSRLSVYTVGSVGAGQNNNFDNHDMNGAVGASVRLDHNLSVGFGILGANSHTNMAFNGKSDLSAQGVSTVFSYLPQYGFRAFGTAFIADLDLTIVRGYANGSGQSASRGTPDGNAHGAAAEIGYAVPVNKQMTVTPFVDTRWSRTSVDAYSETGGPFDADFSTQKNTNVTSHLGTELGYQVNQKTNLYTRASWGYRLSGNGSSFTASTSGVTQSLGLDPGDRNWAEGAIGTNYQASDKIRFSAELSGRTNNTQEPVTTITVGANISF
jgi:probable HAF family extracellular repeat protein